MFWIYNNNNNNNNNNNYNNINNINNNFTKEPNDLVWGDGKKPDGHTLVWWKVGKALTCDAIIVDTHVASYLKVSPVLPSQATETAEERQKAKYSFNKGLNHWFSPVPVETMGPINQEGSTFLEELGNCIA